MLGKPEFDDIRSKLALEWLESFPCLIHNTACYLFKEACAHPDKDRIKTLIQKRYKKSKEENSKDELPYEFWALRSFLHLDLNATDAKDWLYKDSESIFAIEGILGSFNRKEHTRWIRLSADKIFFILDAYVNEWPKVHLPSSWGTGSPKPETAYRFLKDIIWQFRSDTPENSSLYLEKILKDDRFENFHDVTKTIRAESIRKMALQDFIPPPTTEIISFFEKNEIASVEDLRALIVQELHEIQIWLKGAQTDPIDMFYNDEKRIDENTSSKRIAEQLDTRIKAMNLSVNIEHHMKDEKRCDITVSTRLNGREILLVIEAKGQWHKDLYSAAVEQLHARYSIHPSAEDQGIYLIYWFGVNEKVVGKSSHSITSAQELRSEILEKISEDLRTRIDVVVLDLSR